MGLKSVSYLRGRGWVCRIAAGDGGGLFRGSSVNCETFNFLHLGLLPLFAVVFVRCPQIKLSVAQSLVKAK